MVADDHMSALGNRDSQDREPKRAAGTLRRRQGFACRQGVRLRLPPAPTSGQRADRPAPRRPAAGRAGRAPEGPRRHPGRPRQPPRQLPRRRPEGRPQCPEGLDEAREAFAQEIPQATRQRDQGGRFVSTGKPEPIFAPRRRGRRGATRATAAPTRASSNRRGEPPMAGLKKGTPFRSPRNVLQPPPTTMTSQPKISRQSASGKRPTMPIQTAKNQTRGPVAEGDAGEDTSPRYKIQVDGAEVEVSLNEALQGLPARRDVQLPHAPDGRGRQDHRPARRRGPGRARRLHPALPAPGAGVPRPDPQGAQLGAALQGRPGRRAPARKQLQGRLRHPERHPPAARRRRSRRPINDNAQRTASYARAEFDKFRAKNKLANQTEVDNAISLDAAHRDRATASARTRSARPTTSACCRSSTRPPSTTT